MVRFGWTEREITEGFPTARSLELFLDFLGIRDRVLARKTETASRSTKPKPAMSGNTLTFKPRG